MAVLDALVTTAADTVSATVGVPVGGVITRWGQDRQWLRDKQLAVYVDLLRHYTRFSMAIKRGHEGGQGGLRLRWPIGSRPKAMFDGVRLELPPVVDHRDLVDYSVRRGTPLDEGLVP